MTVKNLFEPHLAEELKQRLIRMQPGAPQWGRMNSTQALAHCTCGLHMAMGVINPKPAPLPARIIGALIKPLVFGDDKPMRRNSPSSPELFPANAPASDFEHERTQLIAAIDTFVTQKAACCSPHPHPFFGRLTPQQWAILAYKHLDHHLRQFNV
jgi:hypothetical protein